MSDYPAGSIIIPMRDDLARYNRFYLSLLSLKKPPRTRVSMLTGMSIAEGMNRFIREEMHGEWLLTLGDDHIFEPTMLLQLLDRDVDAVAPLCFTRRPPYFWTIFRERVDGTPPRWITYEGDEVPSSGLFPVRAVGSSGLLLKRHVLDAIDDPWIENVDTVHLGEDLRLCDKIRAAGFEVHVDLDVRLGHLGTCITNPEYRPGEGWGNRIDFAGGPGSVFVPGTDQRRFPSNSEVEYGTEEIRGGEEKAGVAGDAAASGAAV